MDMGRVFVWAGKDLPIHGRVENVVEVELRTGWQS